MKIPACIAALSAALVLAACGGGSDGDSTPTPAQGGGGEAADGAQVFTQNCANCHTLAAAGSKGQVGPNLDDLRPGPDLVKTQTENGGGAMPSFKGKLTPEQIQAVADYVSENAGKGT